ncbi:MobP3 family relaxase [Paenibacillus sp. NPDC093718]|uniref:MobP3 family relaxase n=1 Tax=Paenibacillus sp. NPDC093718 TaxID=3390601 RepID=UPI003D07A4E5
MTMNNRFPNYSEEHARFSSPVIFKMRFYVPEKGSKVTQSKNAAHIRYIGTRPGTDLGETDLRSDRDWDNELDVEVPDPGTAAGHVKYADERPGSHGLFSYSDEKPDLQEVQQELMEHKGLVWRMVLSLAEEDAKRLGYTERGKWEDTVRSSISDAAAKMGITETNLKWVAAFHQEQGHPHVHIVMWEKNPIRRRGQVYPKLLEDMKKTFAKEIFAEERMILNQEKTAMRELMRSMSKEDLSNAVQVMRDVREMQKEIDLELNSMGVSKSSLAPKLFLEDRKEIADRIQQIAELLPQKGRIAYKYMPENVKQSVSDTSRWLLNSPSFNHSLSRYYSAVERMTRQYTTKEDDINKAKENAYKDLEKRISQIVLRAAAESKKNVYLRVDPDKAREVIYQFSHAMGKPEDTFAKDVIVNSMKSLRDLNISFENQARIAAKWGQKADLQLNSSEVFTLVREVNLDPPSEQIEDLEKRATIAARVMRQSGELEKAQLSEFLRDVGISEEAIPRIVRDTENGLKESNNTFLDEDQWRKLTELAGVKVEYPWEQKQEQEVLHEMKGQIVEAFRNGLLTSDSSAGHTAFCMTVALKQLGLGIEERQSTMTEFAEKNGIHGIGKILKTVEEADTNFLRKDTWAMINSNLKRDIEYPWVDRTVWVIDEDKFKDAFTKFQQSNHDLSDESDVKWVATQFANFLRNRIDGEKSIRAVVSDFLTKSQHISPDQINDIDILQKRTGDIPSMAKLTGVRDQVATTVTNFSKVLFAAGMAYDQVKQIIADWNERTGLNKDAEYLDKIINTVEKQYKDQAEWGRPPVLSKKDFQNLNQTLQTNAPYMWANSKEFGRSRQDSSLNIAGKLWKSLWNGLEQERIRIHAKGELMKKQNQRRLERIAEQERD